VVTATPRGAALGLLERFALQASADPVVSGPLAGELGADRRRGAAARGGLSARGPRAREPPGWPGAVAPLVLRDQDGLAVYAFLSRGMPGRALASLAAALHRALDGVVPPVDSIALRLAACRVLVRRLAGPGRSPALLVLGSVSIDRPGLARLELERTAARLAAVVGG